MKFLAGLLRRLAAAIIVLCIGLLIACLSLMAGAALALCAAVGACAAAVVLIFDPQTVRKKMHEWRMENDPEYRDEHVRKEQGRVAAALAVPPEDC